MFDKVVQQPGCALGCKCCVWCAWPIPQPRSHAAQSTQMGGSQETDRWEIVFSGPSLMERDGASGL